MNDLQNQIMRIAEARRFFDLLYGGVKKTTYGYLWTLPDNKTYSFDVSKPENRMKMARKAIELNDTAVKVKEQIVGHDVYFGVCLTDKELPMYRRTSLKDNEYKPTLQTVIWTDIDVEGGTHISNEKTKYTPDIKTAISFLPFQPSIVVDSGYGIHGYNLLVTPIKITADNMSSASRRNTNYLAKIKEKAGDYKIDSVGNLDRVLRVPGTYNYKLGKKDAPLCRIIETNDVIYSIEKIDSMIQPIKPVQKELPTAAQISYPDEPDFDRARVAKMLEYIPADSYDDWVKTAINLKGIANTLHIMSESEAFELFRQYSAKSEKYDYDECVKKWNDVEAGDADCMKPFYNSAIGYDATAFWHEYHDKQIAKDAEHYKEMRADKKAEETTNSMTHEKRGTEDWEKKQSKKQSKIVLRADYFANNYDSESSTIREYAKRNTGFEILDSEQPLPPALIVIGAEPGTGKTTFCYQLAEQIVSNNENEFAIYVSYEMSRLELFAKTLTRQTKIANDKAKQNGGKQDYPLDSFSAQQGKIPEVTKRIIEEMKQNPLNFGVYEATSEDDIDNLLDELEENIADAREKNPAIKSPVVVLDYLQIIPHNKDNHKLGIDGIILKLKEFQRRTKTTFIVISSINRGSYFNKDNNQPSLAAFKESGSIEFTADVAWLLIRDKTKVNTPYKVTLVCLKNRFGVTGYEVNFDFYAAENLFEESDTPQEREDITPKRRGKK